LPEPPLEVAKRASRPTCFSELLAIGYFKKESATFSSPDIRKYVSGHPQGLGGIGVGKQMTALLARKIPSIFTTPF